jgi:hypothetical protein
LSFPIDPKYTTPLTDQQLGALYDYNLNTLVPCLEAEGYEVPDAPSKTTFIDTFLSDPWYPYADAFGSGSYSQAEYYRVSELCPQWPPDLYG